jgi:hemoglobin/transferrin/lactoferrin receptor protein
LKKRFHFFLFSFLISQYSFAQKDSIVVKNLDEIVVSTNKLKNESIIVCNLKNTYLANEIAKNGAATTADLLANMAAVSLQKSQLGGGSPVIRGFEASRVLLMIDGVRLNNLIYRAGHLQNIITIDQASLDKIEVLYGPTSSIYGSDALGGVIHLFTKSPKLNEKSASGYYRFRMPNLEKTINGSYNLGGKKWASYGSITVSSFQDLRMGAKINPAYGQNFGLRNQYVNQENTSGFTPDILVNNPNPLIQIGSKYSQADFFQKILYQPNNDRKHILNIQHSNSSDIPRYDRLTDPDPEKGLKWAEWYYGPQKRWLLAYQLDENKTDRGYSLNLNFQDVNESRHERLFGDKYLKIREEKVSVLGFNFKQYRHFLKNAITYGLDFQYNNLKSTAYQDNLSSNEILPLNTRYADGKNNVNSIAIYLVNNHQISEKLNWSGGLRMGHNSLYAQFLDKTFYPFPFNDLKQNNFTYAGNFGLTHNPRPNLKFSGMIATGFRVPNIDDLSKVFDSSPGLLIVPNPNIKPEKTLNFELGFTGLFTPKIFFETALFYTNFYDAIITDNFNYNGQTSIVYNGTISKILANQNKERARIYGLNSAINVKFWKSFLINASVNYTKGQVQNTLRKFNSPLDHIPPTFGKVGLKYQKARFQADIYWLFNGWKPIAEFRLNGEDNENYATPLGTPAWNTWNGRVNYNFNDKWGIQAGFDNLLDLQYRTFASGINAPGRNFFITLKGGL